MEKIIITLINCIFTNLIFYNFLTLINNCSHKYFEFKKLENKNENEKYISLDEFENICKEITLLKSLHLLNKRAIKNIIKRLPFKGEEWEQEFIKEELDEIEKSGYYENLDKSILCDGNGPIEPLI